MNDFSQNSTAEKTAKLIGWFIGVLLGAGLGLLIAYWLQIDPLKEYGWWGGCWQGGTSIYHWILSFFDDGIIVRAPLRTTAYSVFWWVCTIFNIYVLINCLILLPIKILRNRG